MGRPSCGRGPNGRPRHLGSAGRRQLLRQVRKASSLYSASGAAVEMRRRAEKRTRAPKQHCPAPTRAWGTAPRVLVRPRAQQELARTRVRTVCRAYSCSQAEGSERRHLHIRNTAASRARRDDARYPSGRLDLTCKGQEHQHPDAGVASAC